MSSKLTLKLMFDWGVRSGYQGIGPKELHEPWYDCDQRREFKIGRENGSRHRLIALLRGEINEQ